MKTRESGMPDESMWSSFFNPAEALTALGIQSYMQDVVDFGCGYGTFAVAAAQIVRGAVYAFDVDSQMVKATREKAEAQTVKNVYAEERDFVANGIGLPDECADYAMLFNILHCEQPLALLTEAKRVLRPEGLLAIMHWSYDPNTPRGPSMSIRPKPERCLRWAIEVGFELDGPELIDLPPYHYGIVLRKPKK